MKKEQTTFRDSSWNVFLEEIIIQVLEALGYCGRIIPKFDGMQLHCEDTSIELLEL